MKRGALGYFSCLMLASVGCQDSSSVAFAKGGLTVDKSSINVVVPPDSARATFRFVLRNNTREIIRIKKAIPSCECVLIEDYPTDIVPDSSGKLTATIAFGDKFGSIKQNIAVTDDVGHVMMLELTAHRPLKLSANPEFIQARLDEIASRSVTFVPASGMNVVSSTVRFNDELVEDALAVQNGILEVPLARMSRASFRSVNLLKITCTFSDGSEYERGVPIYVAD